MVKGNKTKKEFNDSKTVSINNLSHFYGKNENKKQVLNIFFCFINHGHISMK